MRKNSGANREIGGTNREIDSVSGKAVGVYHYQRRSRIIVKKVLFCVCLVSAVVIATAIWGGVLRHRAEKTEDSDYYTSEKEYDADRVIKVRASYTELTAGDVTALAEELKSRDVHEISVPLYDGEKIYFDYGQIAGIVPGKTVTSEIDLHDAAIIMRSYGITLHGAVKLTFPTVEDKEVASIYRAYEAAIAAKCFDSGVTDIVLTGFSEDEDGIDDAKDFISAVNELHPGAKIGIALTKEVIDDKKLAKKFLDISDIGVLDLTECENATELEKAIDDMSNKIKKYSLRLLISDSIGDSGRICEEAGKENWQTVK